MNGLFQGAVFLLRALFDEATAGLKDVVTIVSFLLDGNKILNPTEWKKAWEQIVSNGIEASDRVKTAWQQGNDAIDGKGPVKTSIFSIKPSRLTVS